MKKNYFVIMTLLTSSLAFGQSTISPRLVKKQQMTEEATSSQINRAKATLYTNDFGTPAEWGFQVNGTATSQWTIGTAAPSGSFPILAIASTSAANGFALFDSDLHCDPAGTQNTDVYLLNSAVDLSSEPAVQVTFESYYRAYQGTAWVIASTDGVTWDEYEVHTDLDVNDASANPELTSVNVSATIGGSATAYIGFRYKGGCDYAWMVDDVQIETVPPNELKLVNAWHGDIVNDWEYSMLPLSQTREMIVGVAIVNNGSTDETPLITCEIHDANGVVATPTAIAAPIAIGVTDTIWFNTGFTPSANGVYHAEFSIPDDFNNANNNVSSSTLTINDNLMAHDYGSTSTFGWNHTSTNPDIVAFANAVHSWGEIYTPTVTQDVYGMDVWIATGTTVGNYLLAQVYQIDPDGDGSWVQGDLSGALAQVEINVTAADVNALKKVSFPSPIQLTAGESYIFELQKADGTTSSSFFVGGTSGNAEDDDNAAVGYGDYSATPGTITYFTSWDAGYYIRANFENTAGIGETTLSGVSIYPNPSEGIVNITNDNNAQNSIEVYDMLGNSILSTSANTATTVDLSANATGIYMIVVSNENGSVVERVSIK